MWDLILKIIMILVTVGVFYLGVALFFDEEGHDEPAEDDIIPYKLEFVDVM